MLGFYPIASRPIGANVVATAAGITATLAVILDGISFDGAIVSGHNATIAFALDSINVAMTATNSGAPPTPGLLQTLIEIRSFTERRF